MTAAGPSGLYDITEILQAFDVEHAAAWWTIFRRDLEGLAKAFTRMTGMRVRLPHRGTADVRQLVDAVEDIRFMADVVTAGGARN